MMPIGNLGHSILRQIKCKLSLVNDLVTVHDQLGNNIINIISIVEFLLMFDFLGTVSDLKKDLRFELLEI